VVAGSDGLVDKRDRLPGSHRADGLYKCLVAINFHFVQCRQRHSGRRASRCGKRHCHLVQTRWLWRQRKVGYRCWAFRCHAVRQSNVVNQHAAAFCVRDAVDADIVCSGCGNSDFLSEVLKFICFKQCFSHNGLCHRGGGGGGAHLHLKTLCAQEAAVAPGIHLEGIRAPGGETERWQNQPVVHAAVVGIINHCRLVVVTVIPRLVVAVRIDDGHRRKIGGGVKRLAIRQSCACHHRHRCRCCDNCCQ
jgi:hypothetical protein